MSKANIPNRAGCISLLFLSLVVSCNGIGADESVPEPSAHPVREYSFVSSIDSLPTPGYRGFLDKALFGRMNGVGLREEYLDTAAQIIADTLILRVTHADGCQDHEFKLFVAPSPDSSNVAIALLRYRFTPWGAGEEICFAMTIRWLRFALAGIREDLGVNGTIRIQGAPEALSGSSETYVTFSLTY